MESYDMIVIGSGIGGLTAASLAAQLMRKRVLVLERHWRLGGFTHAFERRKWRWDVGLHYVGGLTPGSDSRRLFDLVTGNMPWESLPDRFDVLHLPEGVVSLAADERRQEAELASRFPSESRAIRRYYSDLRACRARLGLALFAPSAPQPLRLALHLLSARERRLASRTTQEYLDRSFSDPALKRLIAARWGDFGLAPRDSAFGLHAMVLGSYEGGAARPVGGASSIQESVSAIVRGRGGGSLCVNVEAVEILVEAGRAVGVRVRDRKGGDDRVVKAPLLVSDAGAYATYFKLLPPELVPDKMRAKLERLAPRSSAVTLYLGLREGAQAPWLTGANHWIVGERALENSYATLEDLTEGRVPLLFISSDPGADGRLPTVQVLANTDITPFAPWLHSVWKRRGEDYERLKSQITSNLLRQAEQALPGLSELVAYSELSTPLTVHSFTGHHAGAIYGLAGTPERFAKPLSARTTVPGVYLAGADVCTPGIQGALMGGVFSIAAIMGAKGMPTIMSAARRA